jgi:serine/threonine protein kinase/tetratricopeptide (TPR) repeat protein
MRILNEGTRLADRYTLIRRLGAGGMSEIWLASDQRSDARVALKFVPGDAASDPKQRDLLKREWRIGSRLMHANIIRVFEFHDDPDGPCFGLQYVGETNIGVLCGKDPAESMRPIGLIADALRYAHGKDVVHRDIKASNVLLDSRGMPYLVDFGVAANVGDTAVAGSGSDIAMSPQQQSGGAAAFSDDIFALGVLMHELLTGSPPGGAEMREVAAAMQDGRPIPGALRSLLSDMLSSNASLRPAAEAVAARLAEAGFPAGPAPARYASGERATEEIFRTVQPAQHFRRAAAAPLSSPASLKEPKGIPPKVLYGALGAALVVFLAVIFVLPAVVDRERPSATSATSETAESAAEIEAVAESMPDEDDGAPAIQGSDASFSENVIAGGGAKAAADEALGDLLSQLERLRYRAIDRWGGQPYLDAVNVYAEGDQAYVDKNYRLAGERYREASRLLEPFFDQIETVFDETLAAAKDAIGNGDPSEAVRLFDLAVAITPGHREAEAGLERAKNLDSVLSLMEQGIRYEEDLELDAAKLAFENALSIDPLWEPASQGLERIKVAIKNLSFSQRMTEGFDALYDGDFDTARAAFNAAKLLNPTSREPADGLLQVDQEARLADIRRMEDEANKLNEAEQWESSIATYQDILKIDPDLQFAHEGLALARSRAAIHSRLQEFIDDPDSLSEDANMQNATRMLLDITRVDPMGPRLEDQKNELARLLKRAATPLRVQLVSDNQTEVSVFRVGRFGLFDSHELELRPGNYVAVGIRPGYRDVRIEFRVAPEIDMQPVVVQCEEAI